MALRSRWWPSWVSPEPNRKASKPPTGTVNNMDGTGKPKRFSVWAMKVDTIGVRSTIPGSKHVAVGWGSTVIALDTLARARDQSLAAIVAALLLAASPEQTLFLPIVKHCLEQDCKALFSIPSGSTASSARGTEGLAGQAEAGVPGIYLSRALPGADQH